MKENPFAILTRHFFERYFENELVAPAGELRTGIAGMLAVVTVPGLLLPLMYLEKYSALIAWLRRQPGVDRDLATLPDKYIFLALAFVIPGLATLLKWDSLFPGRQDHAILTPLPIPVTTIFLSKLTALAAFFVLFAVAVNLIGSLLYPPVVLEDTGTLALLGTMIAGQFLATMGASLVAALLVVGCAGFWMNVLPAAGLRRAAPWVQFALLVFFLTQLLLAPRAAESLRQLEAGAPWRLWLFPPLWFLGWNEQFLGRPQPEWAQLAGWARIAIRGGLAINVIFYLLSYRRHFRRTAEIPEAGVAPGRGLRLLPDSPDPHVASVAAFVRQTIGRSAIHRLLFGALFGIGCAIILEGLAVDLILEAGRPLETQQFILSAPLVVSFFLLVSLRFLFDIPAERAASWVFRFTLDGQPSGDVLRGARRAMFELGVLPWLAGAIPLHLFLWGPALGAAHTLFCLMLSLVLMEALIHGFRKVPFTSTFGSGRANAGIALLVWYTLFSIYAYSMTKIESALLRRPVAFAVALAVAFIVWRLLAYVSPPSKEPERPVQFVDNADPVVQTLDL
jgi:hypothetical protein